jgi:uncharacterized protein YvpB
MRFLLRVFIITAAVVLLSGFPHPTSASRLVLLSGFPALRQQHSLTCESSAVSMGTRGVINEGQLMAAMPRNPDPNLGFRGNPDGQQGTKLIDYGVYAAPLQKALLHYEYNSAVLTYVNDAALRSYLNRGWPVVAWVTYHLQRAIPRLAYFNGIQFVLVPHEHAVLVVGYDARGVLANDPFDATLVRYSWRDFNRAWGYFGNMALAVEPCPMAQPVSSVRVTTISATALTWTWDRARNATRYNVTVTRPAQGPQGTIISQSSTTATRFTLNSPLPRAVYEIDVTAISACGDLTTPTRQIVRLPRVLPGSTPTPTPAPERTAVLTPSPTASPTPTLAP